jgi:hypothetical protein
MEGRSSKRTISVRELNAAWARLHKKYSAKGWMRRALEIDDVKRKEGFAIGLPANLVCRVALNAAIDYLETMEIMEEQMASVRTCTRPDRDEPRLVCGYPLPCPHHTTVIDGEDVYIPVSTSMPSPAAMKRVAEVAGAIQQSNDDARSARAPVKKRRK